MGMNGRKNCRVIGSKSDVRSRVATAVFTKGPGLSMMLRQKIPRMAIIIHCPSFTDHLCACNALIVSAGENEVCKVANEDAGDCLLRSFDRSVRRSL